MNLNLGAGDDVREDYVNVDLRPDRADVLADVRNLPFSPDSADHILALDILEHLPPAHSLSTLRHWHRILVPGGRLTLRVPNLYQLARWIIDDHYPVAALNNIYGGHKFGPDGELDHHCTGWTPALMFALLADAGFTDVTSDLALNMTFTAVKP